VTHEPVQVDGGEVVALRPLGRQVAHAELEASRARIVAAADDSRRRIQRDLHDGAQQRLVSLALEVQGTAAMTPPELTELRARLSRISGGVLEVIDELRRIARGIHPAVLTDGGLVPALTTLTHRSAVPVVLDVQLGERLPESVEVAAYYLVSEALANAAKHAQASVVRVQVTAGERALRILIRDDGIGGADAARGSGLIGLSDRVEALGGIIDISSPVGGGTTIRVRMPVAARR
jgi:signal transduction histidine kinase